VSALEVIARNTAFQFKGRSVDVCDIAKKLGVSHVLEGSVRKAGNRVRITAQLIDGAGGGHIWADRYDRDLTDIFEIQDEISHAIVDALKVKLLPEEKKAIENRGTENAEAYNLYLMARQFWISGNHGDPKREERVVRLCRKAVEIDPAYARAWALMALAEANLKIAFNRRGDGGVAAAERALSLDPEIAEAHCAIARNLAQDGKVEEANAKLELALKIDPESWEANKAAGSLYYQQRRILEAKPFFEKAASLLDTDFHTWGMLVACYRWDNDQKRVLDAARMLVERAQAALKDDPSNGMALGMIAGGLAIIGEKERAKEWIDRAILLDPENRNMRYNFACVLANELNDPDAAVDILEPAYAQCTAFLVKVAESDPDFDSLRGNPRFEKMLADARERLGIDAEAPASSST
jgi:adenylate cyclase